MGSNPTPRTNLCGLYGDVMNSVLVAGIGFIGLNLVEELIDRGVEVTVIARRSSSVKRPSMTKRLSALGVNLVLVDEILEDHLASLAGDVYYYLAGKLWGDYNVQWEAHVGLLNRTINAVSSIGARLVHVSSIAAIGVIKGAERGYIVREEESHLEGERVYVNTHMKTKAEGEKLVVKRGVNLKGKWSIIRPGIVFGPWGCHPEWVFLYRAVSLRITPKLGRGMPHIYSRDLASILADAGDGGYDSKWIIAVDPLHPDMADIAREICKKRGYSKCFGIPIWGFMRIAGSLAPRNSPIKLAYTLLNTGYRYESRYLSRMEWTPLEDQVTPRLTC